jgi:hypothetical protein
MFKVVLEIFTVGCGLMSLVALIMVISEGLFKQKLSNLPLSRLPVRKTTYCRLVLDWCHNNLSNPNTSKPTLRVNYYNHKKWGGVYQSGTNECVIYVNSHDTILGVTNSIIHEYVHSRQRSRSFDKMYNKYNREIGYEQNPFEVEARDIAKKYEKECLLWVYSQISTS